MFGMNQVDNVLWKRKLEIKLEHFEIFLYITLNTHKIILMMEMGIFWGYTQDMKDY